jgi:small GTP-binding protein
MDYLSITIENGNELVKMQIWDTSGQERFRSITPSYLRMGDVTLVCFSCNDIESFKAVDGWIYELRQNNVNSIILVGTKGDMHSKVTDAEALACASRYNSRYVKTSSMTGLGRQEILDQICIHVSEDLTESLQELTQVSAPAQTPIVSSHRAECCTIL